MSAKSIFNEKETTYEESLLQYIETLERALQAQSEVLKVCRSSSNYVEIKYMCGEGAYDHLLEREE